MPKPLTVWITTNCRKFLNRWEYQSTCLLRNIYAGQEGTVRTRYAIMDWFKIGKGVCQGYIFSSVQLSHSVMFDSLQPHESQHTRPPCPSQTPGVFSNSCPSSWWCHPTISSSVVPFSRSLLKLMPIKLVMRSNYLILCCPLLLLPPIPPSVRVFSNESTLRMRWPKYWSFSFSISPSNEHPGLISFSLDRLDLLAVQGTLKSLLQHHSSKTSIIHCSACFTVQLSHPYMTTGKTIALTRWTFVDKVMSLLFNMLSRLVITFLPRNMHLLISWLQPPSAVILEPPKNKVWHCFHCLPIYLLWGDGTRFHDFSFLNVKL